MNWVLISFIILSTAGWTLAMHYDKIIKEKDSEIYKKKYRNILIEYDYSAVACF